MIAGLGGRGSDREGVLPEHRGPLVARTNGDRDNVVFVEYLDRVSQVIHRLGKIEAVLVEKSLVAEERRSPLRPRQTVRLAVKREVLVGTTLEAVQRPVLQVCVEGLNESSLHKRLHESRTPGVKNVGKLVGRRGGLNSCLVRLRLEAIEVELNVRERLASSFNPVVE